MPAYIPELDFVAEIEGILVGHVIYSRAKVVTPEGTEVEVINLGPISVLPEYNIEPINDFLNQMNKRRAEVVELISQIPEDKVREMLAGFVMADEGLKNKLAMQYAFKMNSKLML